MVVDIRKDAVEWAPSGHNGKKGKLTSNITASHIKTSSDN